MIQSMNEFNNIESGNDIFLKNKSTKVGSKTPNFLGDKKQKLVNINCSQTNNGFQLLAKARF